MKGFRRTLIAVALLEKRGASLLGLIRHVRESRCFPGEDRLSDPTCTLLRSLFRQGPAAEPEVQGAPEAH